MYIFNLEVELDLVHCMVHLFYYLKMELKLMYKLSI